LDKPTRSRASSPKKPPAEPPTIPPEPPALAYIEKTVADSYRKEIDQEENVWRSVQFFAATLALQVAGLIQIIDKLPEPTTITGIVAVIGAKPTEVVRNGHLRYVTLPFVKMAKLLPEANIALGARHRS
jgi:hypothetical protein